VLEDWESEQYEIEQERFERPDDYNVWEEARIAEDMDIERAEREAEGNRESLAAIVDGAMDGLVDSDDQRYFLTEAIVEALVKAGVGVESRG
jgi:hypothetical protein